MKRRGFLGMLLGAPFVRYAKLQTQFMRTPHVYGITVTMTDVLGLTIQHPVFTRAHYELEKAVRKVAKSMEAADDAILTAHLYGPCPTDVDPLKQRYFLSTFVEGK